ncbi:hypothetical protein Dda_4672 [Drechslerella dactyloides]|uniref:Uncharacterized protein n=1 Tax=Drechslerella dactyloides TaxID=74499 RepID=A0AAD6J1K2_DREDA|nr:hypothetical protein Dda_4672 [Drechslerella dactyloides]
MEVDHAAMNQAANAAQRPSNAGTQNTSTMEHDPATAPQLADPAAPPPMSYQSGAVPDHYESYPEVMPAPAPSYQTAYPPPSQPISPAPTSTTYTGGYQPSPASAVPQGQPFVQPQGVYHDGPMPVDAEKTYYQPVYGVSQPPPPGAPYAAPPGAPPPGKVDNLPAPAAYNPPPVAEKKILGLKKKTFWIILVIVIIAIIAGVVGGVVAAIVSKNKSSGSNSGQVSPNTVAGTGDGSNNSTGTATAGYTPFPLTTGVRTLNLKYAQKQGSCNDPQHVDGGAAVNCHATSKYQVSVSGDVKNGYRLSSVNVDGSAFNDILGTAPTTSDPNQTGSAWVFIVRFSQSGDCSTDRTTRYAFGQADNNYAVGE